MNKKDIVYKLKEKHKDIPLSKLFGLITDAIEIMAKALKGRENIKLYNFGELYFKKSNVRNIHDFKTNKHIPYSGRFNIKFRASKDIQEESNKEKA